MDPDPDSGGPKTCGPVGSGFGSGTLQKKFFNMKAVAEAELAVNLVVLVPLTENITTHSSPQKIIQKIKM